ncbi:tRNA (adenine(22)-N(1))-methyltransferase TrmK [Virgibacillus soli]
MNIQLSERLKTVASFLPKGAYFADIGSDHAYLPCYVCSHDQTARAIAGEVNQGPYESAKESIKRFGLEESVSVRLGDGLAILEGEHDVKQTVIAGMGGSLIKQILIEGQSNLKSIERIIAQPNIDERDVRRAFLQLGFQITSELIMEENGHIYEVIVGDKVKNTRTLSDEELLFGPIQLLNKNTLFMKKWKSELQKRLRIIESMKKAKIPAVEKIAVMQREINWIKEVLHDEKGVKEW